MKRLPLISTLVFVSLFLTLSAAKAEPRKLPSWGAACPDVVDTTPTLSQPRIKGFNFNGQSFSRLVSNGTAPVSNSAPLVGCYVELSQIASDKGGWQIGVINRDSRGFYWKNAAQVSWRLQEAKDGKSLITDESNPYFKQAKEFTFFQDAGTKGTCKLKDVYQQSTRLGFDRNDQRITPIGSPKNIIVVIDFPDLPFTGDPKKLVDSTLGPQLVRDFYISNSYGKLNLQFETFGKVIRTKEPSTSYLPDSQGSFYVNGAWQDQRLTAEILNEAQKSVDLLGYQSVSILVSGGGGMGGYYGTAAPGGNFKVGNGVVRNTTVMGVGIGNIDSFVPSWKVLAHELGHLLGFIDLYLPGSGNTTKSPGPFDLMGNTVGNANDFLGWNRWIQGWLDDNSVVCDLNFPTRNEITLNAISSDTGTRMYVTPLSPTKALVIEYRTESINDRLKGEDGLLAYVVDLQVRSLAGPIKILQSDGDIPSAWKTDTDLYATATIEPGQVLTFENMVIKNTKQSKTTASFVIELAPDAEKALATAKAEREQQAEVEAKAEAEFQAQQILASKKVEPTATPTATPTAAKKLISITCVKGKVVKKVTAVAPKCPTGYKKR